MKIENLSLDFSEKVMFSLRSLFERYGYSHYQMSKFEEYDLYARNKDFLISDGVITFTDNQGRLLALKPDVTLSIIKNGADKENGTEKLYYNENVYRTVKGSGSFKEIMQVGLECIGDVDFYNTTEVLMLAYKSLTAISPDAVLDIGEAGFIAEVIDALALKGKAKEKVLTCIREKNRHELLSLCESEGLGEKQIKALECLVTVSGKAENVLSRLIECFEGISNTESLKKLLAMINLLGSFGIKDGIRVDFSVVEDINYYNGIVFKGFIKSVPAAVLCGGQYDRLMKKMKRKSGAIGFAVYLDALERLAEPKDSFDVDAVILYDDKTDMEMFCRYISDLTARGMKISVKKSVDREVKYRQLIRFGNGEVEVVEDNA